MDHSTHFDRMFTAYCDEWHGQGMADRFTPPPFRADDQRVIRETSTESQLTETLSDVPVDLPSIFMKAKKKKKKSPPSNMTSVVDVGTTQTTSLREPSQTDDPPASRGARTVVIKDKRQVLSYSRAIIAALEEATSYNPRQHHNLPIPALYVHDHDYLEQLRELTSELKDLNRLLRAKKPSPAKATQAVDVLGMHANTFMKRFAAMLGSGAALLVLGLLVSLLHQAGIGDEVFATLLKRLDRLH
jgi:hypothetical protein